MDCYNNPIRYTDPSEYAPWWQWAIAGVQVAAGAALCAFVPGAQVLGAHLIVSGGIGLALAAVSPGISQFAGGAGSETDMALCLLVQH